MFKETFLSIVLEFKEVSSTFKHGPDVQTVYLAVKVVQTTTTQHERLLQVRVPIYLIRYYI